MCPHNSRSHWTAILHQMAGTLWMLLFVALNVFYGRWNEEYKTERGWLTIHRTIDSQKHSGWKSPLKLPCLKPTHPHRVHQCHISTVLKHLQQRWFHHLPGQTPHPAARIPSGPARTAPTCKKGKAWTSRWKPRPLPRSGWHPTWTPDIRGVVWTR